MQLNEIGASNNGSTECVDLVMPQDLIAEKLFAVRRLKCHPIEGERSEPVLKTLKRFPEVTAVHTTNGRWDLVVELKTDGLDSFDKALRRIREMKGIANGPSRSAPLGAVRLL